MTIKVLVTGGSGFIGSHVCEHFASLGNAVVAYDNLSRSSLLLKKEGKSATSNWDFLKTLRHIKTIRGSTLDYSKLKSVMEDVDAIVHTAAQTAVTTSLTDPRTDFNTNLLGTFNVLEAARNSKTNPCIVFCSTNKVYGENVNSVPIIGKKKRYAYEDPKFRGISESFSIDQSKHTPYGCSKLGADLYVQDY
ncbi:MAG: SDR family NAD(P)-dependent oxidoreductase, partial [Methanomassiliicoccales archaeon]|nr:SDR family NAD(P)-dependent oxidoreductase [Methanomassiliicoccales archaeon]